MTRRPEILTFLLCVPLVFLFARLPSPEQSGECLRPITVGPYVHLIHNCDSYSITSEVGNLKHFLFAANPWRSRPVYVVAAAGLASALSPVAVTLRLGLERWIGGEAKTNVFLGRFPIYLALMTLNVLFLGLAASLAMRLGGGPTSGLGIGLGAVVVSSDLVHGLFWSQHPSFMNVLVSLGGVFYFVQGCRARQLRSGEIAGLGLAAGVAILVYALSVIWLCTFVLGALFWEWRAGENNVTREFARWLPIFVLTGCGPVLAWLAVNHLYLHVTIAYEADCCKQFVWLTEAWSRGDLATAVVLKWQAFFPNVLLWQGWPGLFAVIGILGLAWFRKKPVDRWLRDPVLVGVLVSCLGILVFNFLQGYFQPRLVNGITLALFVALARVARMGGRERWGIFLLLVATLGQVGDSFLEAAISLT
ncbi:MAG: hypothetical protein ABT940_07960 [Alphaproteobacteria bacterium]